MTGVPAPTGRPAAWTLPRRHPDLCPGSHKPAFHCYPIPPLNTCPDCAAQVVPYSVPSIPGGGRLSPHYLPSLLDLDTEARDG